MNSDILTLTKILLMIPSIKGFQQTINTALEIATQSLPEYGNKTYIKDTVRSALYYNTEKFPKKFKIILNANMDVLYAEKDKFHPVEKNGKLYGRGIGMKSAAAVMITLFNEIGRQISYPLGLQLVTDLQTGGENGTKYQIEQGVRADFVITTASTKLAICNKSKGILQLKLTAKGKRGPGADPWLGENALWKMKQFLDVLEQTYPVPKEDKWITTVNLAAMNTNNNAANIVPSEATVLLDIRYIPKEQKTILQNLKKIIPEDFVIEIVHEANPEYTPEDNHYINQLAKYTGQINNHPALIRGKNFSNDIRHYNTLGIGGVAFGPITGGNYADEEWVDIKSIETYYQILKQFLLAL